ncbi:alginate lyase-domain-containing protein [Mycena rosella]|uniref:Alginate lyase-domain-containing protein n=1 Tax=Mycena rosella TaxID=1033263 RepID=A0AAD7CSW2_MYCRO|nr:alginate lyase-domain-containing protein [Mycena rosella]
MACAVPNTVVLDPLRLVDAKARLGTDPDLGTALTALTTQADSWLSQGPWSVTTKTTLPPGGDIHDYASQAPYFWASNTADGCPYVKRDGQRNPEADIKYPDHGDRLKMFQSSYTLTLAWYYTGNEQYARKAGDILRAWFITPATRMNPNLNHAQLIPCADTGRYLGIIDFSQQYTSVVDAATILASGAPGWSTTDIATFRQWNVDYLNWLETSQFGQDETNAANNHGTYAIMQSAGIALFLNNTALAKQKATSMQARITSYITANGSQPLELARTRSFHYSIYDLIAYTRIAAIGKKIGVDLWGYKGAQGQSIHGAVNFLIPAATEATQWAYPELEFDASEAREAIHASADAGNVAAVQALPKVPAPSSGDLWLLRPAAEQLS